jgi:hypothetical protein
MTYHVAPDVHFRHLDDEVILLDGRGDTYLGLNPTGAVIWETVVTGGSAEDAVTRLVGRFEISREAAAADVDAFLEQLVSSGILLREDA